MDVLPFVVVGILASLFLWGVIAPRSQWRLLVSWTYRDPHADEPSGSAYLIHRILAAFGVVALGLGSSIAWDRYVASLPVPPEPPSALERMWGDTEPVVLNRLVIPNTTPATGLVPVEPSAYQAVDGLRRQPSYLFSLDWMHEPSGDKSGGIVGIEAGPGLVALDNAHAVVLVWGDADCIPRSALVIEGDEIVRVAVYFGRPDLPDGAEDPAGIGSCDPRARDAVPILLPLSLTEELGERLITNLDGVPARKAPVVQD